MNDNNNVFSFFSRIAFAVMNNYQAAAAAAQGYGPPASPHTTTTRGGFPATNSPGPTLDMYSSSADSVGYVQAASPQPSGYPAIAVSRAPLNYSPVSSTFPTNICLNLHFAFTIFFKCKMCPARAVSKQMMC